jgi:hypothetical protein
VQSYTIKAGVRQYRAREIAGLAQQGDREVRIAAADLSLTPRPNDQVVIGRKTYQVVSVNTRSPFCEAAMGNIPSLARDVSHWPAGHCISESLLPCTSQNDQD